MRLLPMSLVPLLLMGCFPDARIVERESLAELLGVDAPDVTGASVEPDSGALVLVETDGTLWRVGDDGVERLWGAEERSDPWMFVPMTDVAAMGGGQYAFTVDDVGLKLDLETGSIADWFCYEPGSFGDWTIQDQATNSLAFDPGTGNLVSQPVTREDGKPIRSDVAEFDGLVGGDLAWYPMDDVRFFASGLAVRGTDLHLVADGRLWLHGYGSARPVPMARLDVESPEGMAWIGEELVVVDAATQELVTVDY